MQVDKVRGETEFRARNEHLPPPIVEHIVSYAVATGTDLNSHEGTKLLDSITSQWVDGKLDINNIDKYQPVQKSFGFDSGSSSEEDLNELTCTPNTHRTQKPPCVKASERWKRNAHKVNADGVSDDESVPELADGVSDDESVPELADGVSDDESVPELLTVPGAQMVSLHSKVEDKGSEGTDYTSDDFKEDGDSSDDDKVLRQQKVTENDDQYKLSMLKHVSGRGEFAHAYVSLRSFFHMFCSSCDHDGNPRVSPKQYSPGPAPKT